MKHAFRSKQRGLSFMGVVFYGVVIFSVFVVGAKLVPTVIEHQAILKALEKSKAGNTVPEVRMIFDKAAAIDDISSVSGKDLEVTKNGDKVVVRVAYNKELELVGPAYLLIKYTGTSK
jgi:beta-lactam-binding protein with PASTA domain